MHPAKNFNNVPAPFVIARKVFSFRLYVLYTHGARTAFASNIQATSFDSGTNLKVAHHKLV